MKLKEQGSREQTLKIWFRSTVKENKFGDRRVRDGHDGPIMHFLHICKNTKSFSFDSEASTSTFLIAQ